MAGRRPGMGTGAQQVLTGSVPHLPDVTGGHCADRIPAIVHGYAIPERQRQQCFEGDTQLKKMSSLHKPTQNPFQAKKKKKYNICNLIQYLSLKKKKQKNKNMQPQKRNSSLF